MNPIILLGSHALSTYVQINRTPKDIDVLASFDLIQDTYKHLTYKFPIEKGKKMVYMDQTKETIVEAEIAWEESNAAKLYDLILSDSHKMEAYGQWGLSGPTPFAIPSLNILYMLKMSHRYLKDSPHFRKTMEDIHFLRSIGATIKPEHKAFYKERMKETYWYKHPKLNTDKQSFFTDTIKYVYDHDDIHEAIKLGSVPAYRMYMKDGAEVECDKFKFFALTHEQRMNGVLEEAYTLALERHQIPNDFKPNPTASFNIALMKVCSSITSGWFREFAWENFYEAEKRFQSSYVDRFKNALAAGKVKPFSGKKY